MRIRQEQIDAFTTATQADVELSLRRGLSQQFARCEEEHSSEALNALVRLGIERAAAHALEAEADVQRYLWLMVLFGSDWERDPQVQWTAPVLAPSEGTTPSERIGKLWEQAQAWRQRVRGQNDIHYQAALRSIEGKSVDDLCKNPSRSQRDLLIQLASMWPGKVAEVGDQPLYDLTRLAVDGCKPFELMDRWAVVLFAELMFLFGAGFVLDPLYPWAAEALAARPGDSVDQKLERLVIATQRSLTTRLR